MTKRPPTPTPETQPYWDGAKVGELRLQRCADCGDAYSPPRPFCPACHSRDVRWFKASGRATLYSYVINHRPRADWPRQPHSIAIVELAEGPRLVSNIVGIPQTPADLKIDMPLQVVFEKLSDDIYLPVFAPPLQALRLITHEAS